jgi:DNA topoisomerase-2
MIHPDIQEVKESEVESDADQGEVPAKEYDYLLGMPMWSLTFEKVEALKNEEKEKVQLLENLKALSIFTMWEKDLAVLEQGIKDVWLDEENDRLCRPKVKAKGKTVKTKNNRGKVKDEKKKGKKAPTMAATLSDADDGPLSIEKILGKKDGKKEVFSESSDGSMKNPFGSVFNKGGKVVQKKLPAAKPKANPKRMKGSDVDSDSSFDL